MGDNTPLQGTLLLETRLELVTSGTVAGTFYGFAFSLYCLYALSLFPQLRSPDSPQRAKFMFSYTTIIMLLGLFNLASNAWITTNAYIGHNDFPGGPLAYGYTVLATQPVFIACNASQLAINILTSAIQVIFPNLLISLYLTDFTSRFGEYGLSGALQSMPILPSSRHYCVSCLSRVGPRVNLFCLFLQFNSSNFLSLTTKKQHPQRPNNTGRIWSSRCQNRISSNHTPSHHYHSRHSTNSHISNL